MSRSFSYRCLMASITKSLFNSYQSLHYRNKAITFFTRGIVCYCYMDPPTDCSLKVKKLPSFSSGTHITIFQAQVFKLLLFSVRFQQSHYTKPFIKGATLKRLLCVGTFSLKKTTCDKSGQQKVNYQVHFLKQGQINIPYQKIVSQKFLYPCILRIQL